MSSRPPSHPPAPVVSKQEIAGKAERAPATDGHGTQEEEMVASGWGDDGEDGMGML